MQNNMTARQIAEAKANQDGNKKEVYDRSAWREPGGITGDRSRVRQSTGIVGNKRRAEIAALTPEEFRREIDFTRGIPRNLPPGETDKRIQEYRRTHPGTKKVNNANRQERQGTRSEWLHSRGNDR